MNDNVLTTTLGRCWAFPPQFSPSGVVMAEGIEAVMQSLRVLFMTEPGERIMRESWGGGMNSFLFQNISDELMAKLHNHIEESMLRHEPRAVLKDVMIKSAKHDASCLQVQISLHLSGSDIAQTLQGELNMNDGQILRLQ